MCCHPERMSRSPERSEGEGSAHQARSFAALRACPERSEGMTGPVVMVKNHNRARGRSLAVALWGTPALGASGIMQMWRRSLFLLKNALIVREEMRQMTLPP